MTPPGKIEEEELEYQKKPQLAPLSMAVAMKLGTSPTLSSFPDSFWVPFLEQEKHDRLHLTKLMEEREHRWRRRPEKTVTARKTSIFCPPNFVSSKQWAAMITKAIHGGLMICLYLALGLFLFSVLDAPYLHKFMNAAAILGRVFMGLSLWLNDVVVAYVRA